MTEYKKLSYELEDTILLGKKLPIVAMNQLPKIAQKFMILPDIEDYLPGTQKAMHDSIMEFVEKNKKYLDDERELKEIFKQKAKLHQLSHYTLRLFDLSHIKQLLESVR